MVCADDAHYMYRVIRTLSLDLVSADLAQLVRDLG